jgi:hypothetical protein
VPSVTPTQPPVEPGIIPIPATHTPVPGKIYAPLGVRRY